MKNLLKELVQAETTTDKGELGAAEVISRELARSKIASDVDCWDQTRANITARIPSAGSKNALLFACHLDVVPPGQASWKYPPFGGVEDKGRIYGRGSTDMKGGIVATVTAIKEIVDSPVKLQGEIIFTATAGEETDSCGVKRFVLDYSQQLPKLAGVVVPEPTGFRIVTAHRGMLWLKVITKGKAAHGSTPHLGINAISSMKSILNELDSFTICCKPHNLLGDCSMSINTISGGKAMNVVPDQCSIGIDIRTLPNQSHQDIIDDVRKIFAKLKQENAQFEADVSVLREVEALETDPNCGFVKDFCSTVAIDETKAVGFTTDGPFLTALGAPVVIFGPGESELCHKPDEYIDLADVEKAVEYYKKIILKFLT